MKIKSKILLSILTACMFHAQTQAESLNLVTENYPPFNMSKSGVTNASGLDQITGISTEIVAELFSKAGVNYTMKLGNWKRNYETALNRAGYGVFSTTRTEEREPLFKWVGPLAENNWVLLAKKGSGITVNSIEDAKKYKVGGYTGDALSEYLVKQGVNVIMAPNDEVNAKKLNGGRIDLWATGQLLGPFNAKKQGISGLEQVLVLKKTILSLALNKSTDDATVAKLNEILATMRSDGSVENIKAKYK